MIEDRKGKGRKGAVIGQIRNRPIVEGEERLINHRNFALKNPQPSLKSDRVGYRASK